MINIANIFISIALCIFTSFELVNYNLTSQSFLYVYNFIIFFSFDDDISFAAFFLHCSPNQQTTFIRKLKSFSNNQLVKRIESREIHGAMMSPEKLFSPSTFN